MASDINIAGYLVPAYCISALVALWSYVTKQRLTKLEGALREKEEAVRSAMRRQEEAFRLVHSPRVTGAVRLWAAFCEFERAIRTYVSPGRFVTEPPDATVEQKKRALDEQMERERQTVAAAWRQFKGLHDEAEVLLPAEVFEPFTDLYKTFEDAFTRKHSDQFINDPSYFLKSIERVEALLADADKKRPAVVAAMRNLISGTDV